LVAESAFFDGLWGWDARIWRLLIGQTKQVIHRGVVIFGETDEDISGDIKIATLIVAVNSLTAIQDFR
jgi:hypothetical protein